MEEERKDLATTEAAGVPAATEDAKADLGFGKSEDNDELIIVPRAALVNTGSPALKDPEAVCKYGDYINSITKQPLKENVFVPIAFTNSWIRFNAKIADEPGYDPEHELGAIIWRANSKNDPAYNEAEASFGPNGERPLATHFLNFLSYIPSEDAMMMVSFSKGSFKPGKELFNMIRSQPGLPFAYKYKLGHISKTGPSGDDYLQATIALAGVNEGESFAKASEIAKQFASKVEQVQADDDSFDPSQM